jgi:hypothetical protein
MTNVSNLTDDVIIIIKLINSVANYTDQETAASLRS